MSAVVPLDFFALMFPAVQSDTVIFVAVALVGVIGRSSFLPHDSIHLKKYAHPRVSVRSDSHCM
jgi:hypothetical protein